MLEMILMLEIYFDAAIDFNALFSVHVIVYPAMHTV